MPLDATVGMKDLNTKLVELAVQAVVALRFAAMMGFVCEKAERPADRSYLIQMVLATARGKALV